MAHYIALAASAMSILGPTLKKSGNETTERLRVGGGSLGFSSGIGTIRI